MAPLTKVLSVERVKMPGCEARDSSYTLFLLYAGLGTSIPGCLSTIIAQVRILTIS
ncbi:hypothetical protein M441DRAFT_54518 [Trichoderma asperellum CBS 433.97]|uniref:Uncharacterized protein n=1 Tax=Trichoderma asperellum (strain ATCC 204424 / CBS 433.97 / NBRC 101777) TaxID=1042311 RepID=A0A2T3ZKX7_TRIA4|nr:hypothetical protein M441DRAFT_54518 [Trichoderma asperellum CBS 433.97]PTB45461.1 hypothetical protein M441DRAFT_54518 [Trichoderma asperellum CBS 433.97]